MSMSSALSASRLSEARVRIVRSSFLRHGALIFAATMGLNAANYAFHFLMTRWLGPATYGTLASLIALTALISIPSSIISMIVVKYAAEFHAVNDTAKLGRLVQVLSRRCAIGAVAIAVLVALLEPVIGQFIRNNDALTVILCGAIAGMGLVLPALRGALQGMQSFRKLGASLLLEGAGRFTCAAVLVYAGFGIRGAIVGYGAGVAVSLVWTLLALRLPHAERAESLHVNAGRLVYTTAAVATAIVALQFIMFVDVVLVKHYFDSRTAGLYGGMALTGKIILFAVTFIPTILLPKTSAAAARGESALPHLAKAALLTALICAGALLTIGAMPAVVLRVVAGTAYVAAAPNLLLYACAMSLLAVTSIVANYLIGIHRYGFVVPCALACAGEVAAICFFHRSIAQVVSVLLAGNAAILVACLGGAFVRVRSSRAAV